MGSSWIVVPGLDCCRRSARDSLPNALDANPWIPTALAGGLEAPREAYGLISSAGSQTEAAAYADEFGDAWRQVDGSVRSLVEAEARIAGGRGERRPH